MASSVSVIIPTFNAASFIEESLRSVLAQTERALEIIVVDDGSTDATVDRVRAFGADVTLIQQANAGVSAARNRGVRAASGDWIAFLDADDVWLPAKLERQVKVPGAPLVYTDRFNFGARGDLPELQSLVTPMSEGDLFLPLLLRGNFITTSSVMIRRSLFLELGGFPEGLRTAEDWDLWLRVSEKHHIGLCPEPLVRYRFGSASLSRNYQLMMQTRTEVVSRALSSSRGRELGLVTRRRVWAETHRTNAWEAGRAGDRWRQLRNYGLAVAAWPFRIDTFKQILKTGLGLR